MSTQASPAQPPSAQVSPTQASSTPASSQPDSPARTWSAVVGALRAAGCVFAEDEARLLLAEARTPQELADMVERRVAGLPLEHVLGWAEFRGLRIVVDPGVFVPRPRTALLVGEALAAARHRPDPPLVVDLCCGSGAVGAALAASLRRLELHAVDVDPAAVRCARRNLDAVGGAVYEGDLYEPLPESLRGRVDILVANAPYVPTAELGLLPPEARLHEPHVALDGGADGLDVLRRVAEAAPRWLAPGGRLLVETSERQSPRAVEIAAAAGLVPRVVVSERLDATAIVAVNPVGDRG
jgi:release factor glutamine methyltransferase